MSFRKLPEAQIKEFGSQAAGIGALADPLRRSLYEFVAAQGDAVGREAVAEALEIPLHTARFHLDRLASDGLLDVEFRRLSGKSGPGAGRPSKLYRRSDREFSVSLPERRYDLVGDILATAIDESAGDGVPAVETMDGVAYEKGMSFAQGCEVEGDELDRVASVLAAGGYEPHRSGDQLILRNCPFDTLAQDHTDLVCGLNESYVKGICEALGAKGVDAVLEPEPGYCCVKIRVKRS
jgi:predicted ArsR family transcriptional regulator